MKILSIFNPLVHFSYAGAFLALSFAGYLIPLPEEIILMTCGYAISISRGKIFIMLIVALSAVLTGDSALYWLARRGSKLTKKLINKLNRDRHEHFRRIYLTNSGRTVFFTRLIVGIRFLGPFLAGSEKLNFGKFLFFDLLALIFYVPTFVYIGYHFHARFAAIVAEAMIIRHILFMVFIVLTGIGISLHLKQKFYKKTSVNDKKYFQFP